MHKCTYCDKELKSNAGRLAHERSCKMKELESDIEVDEMLEDQPLMSAIAELKPEIVTLEVVGEDNYYVGHLRREIKLRGLLTRTYDAKERNKILQILLSID